MSSHDQSLLSAPGKNPWGGPKFQLNTKIHEEEIIEENSSASSNEESSISHSSNQEKSSTSSD